MLDALLDRYNSLPDEAKQEALDAANKLTEGMRWIPNPGPQTDAYLSKADILFVGGSGGGGKSDLGLGLAFNEHQRSLILRRKYVDLSALTDRSIEINGTRKGFNGSAPPKLTTTDGRLIEFGSAQKVGDEWSWQGRPHDLLYVDEAVHFAESQIRFFMGWVRSAEEGQRCRVVLGSNPPLSEEGEWIIRMFAPWVDVQHPDYPEEPGKLRWYLTDRGEDFEVPGPGDYRLTDDGYVLAEEDHEDNLTALSRTFIPSKLKDNPYLMRDKQYKAQQDALPEWLRAAIRDGNFGAVRRDHERQLIPSEWIKAAQDRWTPQPPPGVPMCAIGADIAGFNDGQSGKDKAVIQPRYDHYFAEATKIPGEKIQKGKDFAGEILKVRRDNCMIILDMLYEGAAVYEQLTAGNVDQEKVFKYKGSKSATGRAKHSNMEFYNVRAKAYYRLYEALDPSQPGGSQIALPPSQRLYSDLCAIRWAKDPEDLFKIQLESKKTLVERLGRSTDEGDGVAMAWFKGTTAANIQGGWKAHSSNRRPSVVMGRGANSISRRGKR